MVQFKAATKPVLVRAGTTDSLVAFAIFVKREYWIPAGQEIDVILDLGANVGYSAVYFAHHFPNAKIVSLEPSEENFACLQANTEGYKNITTLKQGVWWREAQLELINPDAESWEFEFRETDGGGVPCVGIDTLAQKYACGRRMMVKIS